MQTKSEPTEVISPEKDVENLISLGCQLNIWVFTKKKELATINSDVMSCNKDFTVGTRKKNFFLSIPSRYSFITLHLQFPLLKILFLLQGQYKCNNRNAKSFVFSIISFLNKKFKFLKIISKINIYK